MKKIVHLTTVHIREDTRIFYKEVQSLKKEFNTTLIVADGKGDDTNRGVRIIDLGKPNNRLSRFFKYGFKAFFLIKKSDFKIVHFHDPELIPLGLILKIFGHSVIFDIHEYVVHDIKTKNWIRYQFIRNLFASIYSICERCAIKNFDHILTAEDGYSGHYSTLYPIYKNKITPIRNFPINTKTEDDLKDFKLPSEKKNKLIYLGAISHDRGIFEIIEAMSFLDDSFELYIIGRWKDDELLKKCKNSKGWGKVKKLGFINPKDLSKYICECKLGLCVLHRLENFAYTTPVKSFEYLMNAVPMLMTDFNHWKKIYSGTAMFVDPYDPKKISEMINKFVEDKQLADLMAVNGFKLALEHCWDNEEKSLLEIYSRIN